MLSPSIQLTSGSPLVLGTSKDDTGINFAIAAKNAQSLSLRFFTEHDTKHPFLDIPLDPIKNKTGDVWHIHISGLPCNFLYAYWLLSKSDNSYYLLLDPYAKRIHSHSVWGNIINSYYFPWGEISDYPPFDWQNDNHPQIPLTDLIIYEMHVRGFTIDSSSKVASPGTFLGVIEKIPHFKALGINAIELLPVFEFNEDEVCRLNLQSEQKLYNYFGYSPVSFFFPMNRYKDSQISHDTLNQFKTMVRELHKNGIEIILDVVYNHTAEADSPADTFSMRGFDKTGYYSIGEHGKDLNFSGCGNTFNANYPLAHDIILASLHYWVSEMHVDGFRFDLASILKRDSKGNLIPSHSIVDRISNDPILSETKLIAEAWDPGGLYLVGKFHDTPRWLEWNGQYRDVIRRFIKGAPKQKSSFATALCGSQDLYGHKEKTPLSSVNFITCHDGFSLNDLVSYNEKHNAANGENNKDGSHHNESWNCGIEGETTDQKILQLREKQMRNLVFALFISQGIPMISMGDEYAHTKRGNNNTWCQDNELNWFLWDKLKINHSFFRFFQLMIEFRKQHKIFNKGDFLADTDITWHGLKPLQPEWEKDDHFLAFTLNEADSPRFYIAFNAYLTKQIIRIPYPGDQKCWRLVINTDADSPNDFLPLEERVPFRGDSYLMEPYSAILFETELLFI